ncbi:hypothetical protein OMW55_03875 [Sphingomonas sp. BN140010]|uniref:Helix-turn-helix domain-containing protein n=1 Tax=Sphingomonas arvum TaxID=2992113 RepID=A0ABT3JCY8_9SPHN|nr:hypothetical protein [Sphingomonas sp. BN140010]MCW3796943.1 hypothetical protein [Sphingomonas sp. BN140010]
MNYSDDEPYPTFTCRLRDDGWTPDKQVTFLQALEECGVVSYAAKAVGMGRQSVYRLRRRAEAAGGDGAAFLRAWDRARVSGLEQVEDSAILRAVEGVAKPVYYQGEQVGERRHFSERLTMFLLEHGLPGRYGDHQARQLAQLQPIATDAEIVEALSQRLAEFGASVMAEEGGRADEVRRLPGPDL